MARRVCVVLVDRANYGRLKPVMRALQEHPDVELQVVAAGTLVLERFDTPVQLVERDGFRVDSRVFVELEGSTPTTMAKSVGLAVIEFASELKRLEPDVVLLIGDKYEALAAGIAAAFMNLCILHMQGGEVSGSIDESTRHALSKLAHFHFPSTQRSREYLIRMGERPDTVLGVGCPSSDLALRLDDDLDAAVVNHRGSGVPIDVDQPFLLAVYHPTTTEFGEEAGQVSELLHALGALQMPTILLWPNIDAGADHISKTIRRFRNRLGDGWLRTLTNLDPEDYLRVLRRAACAVGNSSSFVRDASFLGTPVVLVGHRQELREAGEHVVRVPAERGAIAEQVRRQLANGRYPPSHLYGDGTVAERVCREILALEPYVQKRLAYPASG